jgi:DNA-binding LacI/PurR family transcriptional regulator
MELCDRTASGALSAKNKPGLRISEDIVIFGISSVPESGHSTPPLITVHPEKYEMEIEAVCISSVANYEAAKSRK